VNGAEGIVVWQFDVHANVIISSETGLPLIARLRKLLSSLILRWCRKQRQKELEALWIAGSTVRWRNGVS
jgi:hypothetical protein